MRGTGARLSIIWVTMSLMRRKGKLENLIDPQAVLDIIH
jgi:hypothetical protein